MPTEMEGQVTCRPQRPASNPLNRTAVLKSVDNFAGF